MHKNEFIKAIAERANVTQADAARMVNATIGIVTESLRDGEKVVLTGFGTFEMRQRSARRGIDPQTRKPITIPPSATPGFTASSTFKAQVQAAASARKQR